MNAGISMSGASAAEERRDLVADADEDKRMRSQKAIEVAQLSKIYSTRAGSVEALRRVSFEIDSGEFVSLVGPSGCGKSTILNIVAGLITEYRGTALVDGSKAKAGRADAGIMLQSPVLLPWRTVLDNVLLPIEVFNQNRREARTRATELIDRVGLQGFADKYPWELSGGMQQRVSLARLLVFQPATLLMDEPFAAVDEFTRERLNLQLAGIHESLGRTVLYVTHNIREAVFLSDRVVVLKPRPGEIVEIVDVDLARPRERDQVDAPRTSELVARIRDLLYTASGEEA